MVAPPSQIALPCLFDNGTFARYEPFGDSRHIVARRGREMGFDYGFETGRRVVNTLRQPFELVRYEHLLTCGAGISSCEVLRLPDVELLIPQGRDGFTEDEVERILAAITPR